MHTIITNVLKVIGNRLPVTDRHVYLIGEKDLCFEIEIKKFDTEPRCLSTCSACVFAFISIFTPENCEDLRNMRSKQIRCSLDQNIWAESVCPTFVEKDFLI